MTAPILATLISPCCFTYAPAHARLALHYFESPDYTYRIKLSLRQPIAPIARSCIGPRQPANGNADSVYSSLLFRG
ncbi:exported protein of unknown function [Cupriavidus taiwanensis]|nr:exported protein of unknown function [Cupriavidus taiwanensis]